MPPCLLHDRARISASGEVDHVAVGGGDAEFLMLEVAQSLRHQAGADEQDQGERGLKNDLRSTGLYLLGSKKPVCARSCPYV